MSSVTVNAETSPEANIPITAVTPQAELLPESPLVTNSEISDTAVSNKASEPVTPSAEVADRTNLFVAKKLIKQRKFEEAVLLLEGYLKENPDDAAANFFMGDAYLRWGKKEKAARFMNRTADLASDDIKLMRLVGQALDAAGEYDRAREVIEAVLEKTPDHSGMRFRLALVYRHLGDEEGFDTHIKQVFEREKGMSKLRREALKQIGFEEAMADIRSKDFSSAQQRLKKILDYVQSDSVVMTALGSVTEALGDEVEAESYYRQAIKASQGNLEAQLRLAQMLNSQSRFDEAIRVLDLTVRVGKGRNAAKAAAATLQQLYTRKAEQAVEKLDGELTEQDELKILLGAKFLSKRKAYKGATKILTALIAKGIQEGNAEFVLGEVNVLQGRKDDAIAHMEQAVALEPDDNNLLHGLGRTYEKYEMFGEAEKSYKILIDREKVAGKKAMFGALWRLARGQAAMKAGDAEGALKEYNVLLKARPDDVRVLGLALDLYVELSMFDEMLKAGLVLIEHGKSEPEVHYALAIAYKEKRDDEAYKKYLKLALSGENLKKDLKNKILDDVGFSAARALEKKGRYQDALVELNNGLGVVGDNVADIHAEIGRMYQVMGLLDDAVISYKKAIERDADDLRIKQSLLAIYLGKKEFDLSLALLDEMKRKSPTDKQRKSVQGSLNKLQKQMINDSAARHKEGDYAAAEKGLNDVLAVYPDNAQALYWLGQVLVSKDDHDKGIEKFKKALEINAGDKRLRMALAEAYKAAGYIDDAINTFQALIVSEKDLERKNQARILLAKIFVEKNDQVSANEQVKNIYDGEYSDDVRNEAYKIVGFDAVLVLVAKKKFELARERLDKIALITIDDPEVLLIRAQVLRRLGFLEESEVDVRRVLEVDGNNTLAGIELSRLLSEMGRLDDAIAQYEAILGKKIDDEKKIRQELHALYRKKVSSTIIGLKGRSVDKDEYLSIALYGKKLISVKQYKGAVRLLKALVKSTPDDAQGYFFIGDAYLRWGKKVKAAKYMEQSLSLASNNIKLMRLVGQALDAAGKHERAREVIEAVLERTPNHSGMRFRLALVYRHLGDEEGFNTHIRQVFAQERGMSKLRREALKQIGFEEAMADIRNKDFMSAKERLKRILDYVPDDTVVNSALGSVSEGLKDEASAESYYRKAIEASKGNLDAQLRLARILRDQDRIDAAIRVLDLTVRVGKGRDAAKAAAGTLRQLYTRKVEQAVEKLDGELTEQDELKILLGAKFLSKRKAYKGATKILTALIAKGIQEGNAEFVLGEVNVLQGRKDDAIAHMEQAVALEPDDNNLLHGLGRTYEKYEMFGEAEKSYKILIDREKVAGKKAMFGALWRLARGQAAMKAGDAEGALKEYNVLLKARPDDVKVLGLVTEAYVYLGDVNNAEKNITTVLARKPSDSGVLLLAADIEGLKENEDARIGYLKEAYKNRHAVPGKSVYFENEILDRLNYKEAELLVDADEIRDAAVLLKKITSVVPTGSRVDLLISRMMINKKRYKEAKAVLIRAIGRDKANIDLLYEFGGMLDLTRRGNTAIDVYEKIVELSGETAQSEKAMERLEKLYGARAESFRKQKKLDEALAEYKILVEKFPDNYRARLVLAYVYQSRSEDKKALQQYDYVVDNDRSNLKAHLARAGLLFRMRDYKEAAIAYSYAVALEEDEEKMLGYARQIMVARGSYLLGEGRLEELLDFVAEFEVTFSDSAQAMFFIANIYAQHGERKDAIRAYKRALEIDPKKMRYAFSLGVLYERANEFALAKEQYFNIFNSDTKDTRIVSQARARIDRVDKLSRPITGSLRYGLNGGKSVLGEFESASVSSSLSLSASSRFPYSDKGAITLGATSSYSSNYGPRSDSLSPSANISWNWNDGAKFYSSSVRYSKSTSLLLERIYGSNYSVSGSGGFRFRKLPALFGRLAGYVDYNMTPVDTLYYEDKKNQSVMTEFVNPYLERVLNENIAAMLINDEDVSGQYEVQALYESGISRIQMGDYLGAIETLADIYEHYPDDPYTELSLARAYQGGGEFETAEKYLGSVRADAQVQVQYTYRLAEYYIELGEEKHAIDLLYEMLDWPHREMGVAEREVELYYFHAVKKLFLDLAVKDLSRILTVNSVDELDRLRWILDGVARLDGLKKLLAELETDVDRMPVEMYRYLQAYSAHIQNQNDDVIEMVGGKDEPGLVDEFMLLEAKSFYELGLYKKSRRMVGKIEKAAVKTVSNERLALMGDMLDVAELVAQSHYSDALEQYKTSLAVWPVSRDMLMLLVKIYQGVGDGDGVLNVRRALYELDRSDGENLIALASIYYQSDEAKSLRLMATAAYEDGAADDVLLDLLDKLGFYDGLQYMRDKNLSAALGVMEELDELMPGYALIRINKALIFHMMGMYDEAALVYERVLENEPSNIVARSRYAMLLMRQGRYELARGEFSRVKERANIAVYVNEANDFLRNLKDGRLEKIKNPSDINPVMKTLTLSGSHSAPIASGDPFRVIRSYTGNLTFVYPSQRWGNFTVAYGNTLKRNTIAEITDVDSNTHRFSLTMARSFLGKLNASLNLTKQYELFVNNDSSMFFINNIEVKRRRVTDSVSLSLNYALVPGVSLYSSYSYSRSEANLPLGLVFTVTGRPVARQWSDLGGGLVSQSVGCGVSLRF